MVMSRRGVAIVHLGVIQRIAKLGPRPGDEGIRILAAAGCALLNPTGRATMATRMIQGRLPEGAVLGTMISTLASTLRYTTRE